MITGWHQQSSFVQVHVPYQTSGWILEELADSHVVHTGQFFFEEEVYKQVRIHPK